MVMTVAKLAQLSGLSETKIGDAIRGGGLRCHFGSPLTTTDEWVQDWADNGKPTKGPWRRALQIAPVGEVADSRQEGQEGSDRDRGHKGRGKGQPQPKAKKPRG